MPLSSSPTVFYYYSCFLLPPTTVLLLLLHFTLVESSHNPTQSLSHLSRGIQFLTCPITNLFLIFWGNQLVLTSSRRFFILRNLSFIRFFTATGRRRKLSFQMFLYITFSMFVCDFIPIFLYARCECWSLSRTPRLLSKEWTSWKSISHWKIARFILTKYY